MDKATLINQLPRNDIQEEQSQIVQNILNDLEDNSGGSDEQNEQYTETQQRYQNRQFAQAQEQQVYQDQDDVYSQDNDPQQYVQKQMSPQPRKQMGGSSLSDRLLKELKSPLVIVLLFVLLNLEMVDTILGKYVPKISSAGGGLNIFGLVFKAVLAGLIYYVVSKFL